MKDINNAAVYLRLLKSLLDQDCKKEFLLLKVLLNIILLRIINCSTVPHGKKVEIMQHKKNEKILNNKFK